MRPLWIIGSGGHAAVVIDTVRASSQFEPMGCLDDNIASVGQETLGLRVVGTTQLEDVRRLRVSAVTVAVGNNATRSHITERLFGLVSWKSVVHPTAYVGANATIGEGSVIMAGAIIQPNTTIGRHAIINTGATIDHDSQIGDFAHIGPGCHLAGNVTVSTGTQLGVGALVIPGVAIGEWSIVGAGAVVTRDIPANVTAVGTPAKIIKERQSGWHR